MTDPILKPRDEAVALLHATAEVEHSLMVQYLYAAYSLSDSADAAKAKKVELLRSLLLHIAREEMAHLATVQNLLQLLGAPLHLDRVHSPFASELLPFRFKLEPVSLFSLAKYLIAESPRPLPDDGSLSEADKIMILGPATEQAKASNDGICPSHVGDIFTRLIWLFEHCEANGGLSDADFRTNTEGLQAAWNDWGFDPKFRTYDGVTIEAGESLVRQFAGSDLTKLRADAVAALRAISEQGEGVDSDDRPPSDKDESHFEWFLQAYKTFKELSELGGSLPVHNVPICPNASHEDSSAPYHKMVDAGLQAFTECGRITNPRSRRWAQLFNLRYRILLTQFHHFLRIDTPRYDMNGDRTARGYLLIGVFNEMRRLKKIAGMLVTLPKGSETDPHRAGPTFELPYTTQIPDTEENRWRMHLDTSNAAIDLIDELLASDVDKQNGFLIDVKSSDEADQRVMTELAAGRPLPPQTQDFPKVVRILEEAVRGFTIGGPHGNNLWAGQTVDSFKTSYGKVVVPGDPSGSMLIQRLTDTSPEQRMPRERPALPQSRIDSISDWILRHCPDSSPPYPGLQRERDPIPASNSVPTSPVIPSAQAPSFVAHIRPLFTSSDIACMKAIRGFDLSDFDDVKSLAATIFQQLDAGLMPPTARWPQGDIDLFKLWMDSGFSP